MYCNLMTKRGMVWAMTAFRFPDWIRASLVQRPVMEALRRAFREVLAETR